MRQQGVGDPPGGSGFSVEMYGMRASDYDRTQNYREEYKGFKEERVK